MARVSTTPGNTTVRVLDAGLVGPIGPAGPQGNQGNQGPEGPTGFQGPQGSTGPASNLSGPQGAQGSAGPASNAIGPQGTPGSQGALGPQGAEGPTGSQGSQGSTGPSGNAIPAAYSGSLVVVSPNGTKYQIAVSDAGSLSTVSFPGGIVVSSLLANMDASNTDSYPGTGLVWYDLTSNDNDAEIDSGITFSSTDGGIFEWSSANEAISFTDASSISSFSLGNNAPLTIQMWVYLTDNDNVTLLDKQGGSPIKGYAVTARTMGSDNRLSLSYDGYGVNNTNSGLIENGWQLLTFIFKDTQPNGFVAFEAYVNTTSVWTTGLNPITSWAVETSALDIGIHTLSAWGGKLGAMYVYDGELSASDIEDNYNATKTRFGL